MAKFLRHNRTGESRPVHAKDGRLLKAEQRRRVTLASATLIGRAQISRAVESKDWQAALWDFFDEIGELRFAVRWLANAISRCTLYVGTYAEEGAEPAPVRPPDNPSGLDPEATAVALLEELHYGQIGQAEMLRRMALHLSLPGETYLVGLDPRPDDGIAERRWYVATTDELKVNSRGNSTLVLPDTGQTIKLDPDNSTIIRMWVPHPRRGSEPDSAVRATLPVLREIKGLSDHIAATIDSRLAGAGLLKIPQSASTPNPSQSEPGSTQALHDDPFINALMVNMITPIRDRDDASAVVPLVIKVPDDAVAGIEHVDLSTELSEKVAELREAALDRFAAGADLPREIVTGTGAANHWSAWQLEEASIKLYVEPLIGVICDALTQQYLWPLLKAAGVEDPTPYVVWYNAAELAQRPNKSAEAQNLWDKGVLSTEALLRENGFSTQDMPEAQEHARWIAERLALAYPSLIPGLAPLLEATGLGEIAAAELEPAPTTTPGSDDADQDRTLPGGTSGPTATVAAALPATGQDWWLRTVEQVVLRALELAGKRLLGSRSRAHRHWQSAPRQVLPWDIYTVMDPPDAEGLERLLDGAYDSGTVNFARDECVRATVDAYCRHLITTGQPHRREYLATWLTKHGCTPQLQD